MLKSSHRILEKKVFKVFNGAKEKLLDHENFRLELNASIRTSSMSLLEFDLIILYKEVPLAIVEIKARSVFFTKKIQGIFNEYCKIIKSNYCFFCTESEFRLFKSGEYLQLIDENSLSVDNLSNAISNILESNEKAKKEFEELDDNVVLDHLNSIIHASKIVDDKKIKLQNIISGAKPISFDNASYFLDEDSERNFFINLLKKSDDKICRYTSIPSIFRTINDKEQGMCSIICMNDKSEILYASKRIGYETIDNHVNANNCYILSCANIAMKDNLMMWRLYGDDGKGVNIEYEVDFDCINNNSAFAIAHISYAEPDGSNPDLDLIRDLLSSSIAGAKLHFNEWNIWQHFFKPYEYREEQEVRLLFWFECDRIDNHAKTDDLNPPFKRKWIIDSQYGIIAPIACFKLLENPTHFPLKISKITVGPKNNEKEINCDQLREMAESRGFCIKDQHDFTDISRIKHYR